jgi:ABC-2 type transport system ATP-binding protein
VSKAFGRTCAVDEVDLVVERGEIVALVGPNGSGKTTVLRVVAGLCRPDAGTVEILGAPAGSRGARGACALVPDDPAGLDELTVDEHVALLRALSGASAAAGESALAALSLAPLRHTRTGALSRGQRRRVALAAALASEPRLLLVDEATATLDAEATAVTRRLLRSSASGGAAVLLASHDLSFVEAVADRVLLMRRGRIVGSGPASLVRALTVLEADAPAAPMAMEDDVRAAVAG